jgi:hypothetical protein
MSPNSSAPIPMPSATANLNGVIEPGARLMIFAEALVEDGIESQAQIVIAEPDKRAELRRPPPIPNASRGQIVIKRSTKRKKPEI